MPALPACMQGADFQPYSLTWVYQGLNGAALDLTGASLTGTINPAASATRAIAGTLTITGATNGQFDWQLVDADVTTAGIHKVQFVAGFAGGKDQKTLVYTWEVKASL